MITNIDCLIIGAGPAGIAASNILATSNIRVMIVAKQLGGVYSSEGSVISNSLLYFSQVYDRYKLVLNNFLDTDKPSTAKLDFKRVKRYIDANTSKVRKSMSDAIENSGVPFVEASAEFVSHNQVMLTLTDGTKHVVKFQKCIIAVGSNNQKLVSSLGRKPLELSAISSLQNIPSTVAVVGGGLIGVEVATFFSRLGSKVTIIEQGDTILPNIDQSIAKRLDELLTRKRDITIINNRKVLKIDKVGQKYLILFDDLKIEAEEVFLSIGRQPSISTLNLEVAGVVVENSVPKFDSNLATDNKNIFVAGDVANIHMQTSWAFHSGVIAAKNIMGEDITYDEASYPTFISTDPEVGYLGYSEEIAKKLGYDYATIKINSSNFYTHLMSGDSFTVIKVIYNKADKSFLGVYVLGSGVREILSAFNIFMQTKVKVDEISGYIGIRPIYNELFNEIAGKVK